jgi:hypothetical protein
MNVGDILIGAVIIVALNAAYLAYLYWRTRE